MGMKAGASRRYDATSQSVPISTQVQPPPPQSEEDTYYSDNRVTVTRSRIMMGGKTYALRNITCVRMTFTPPRIGGFILLALLGIVTLFYGFFVDAKAPTGFYLLGSIMILGGYLGIISAKNVFHVDLASTAGEVHALSSNNKVYVEKIVLTINRAIRKCRR